MFNSYKLTIKLPANYNPIYSYQFNLRDTQNISERFINNKLQKGLIIGTCPVLIELEIDTITNIANCNVLVDGLINNQIYETSNIACYNILGLKINTDEFNRLYCDDEHFSKLIKKHKYLNIIQTATVYEALIWAILGQQISTKHATTLRRNLILYIGRQHSSGIFCFPSVSDVSKLCDKDYMQLNILRTKANSLIAVSNLIVNGLINLELSENNTIDAICSALLKIKGIGPWTINYILLRGYGYADCTLQGDSAIQRAVCNLFGGNNTPSIKETEQFLNKYSPYRTIAAAHLWESLRKPS